MNDYQLSWLMMIDRWILFVLATQVYPHGYYANDAAGPIILRDLVCVGSESSLYSAASPPPGCSNGESTVDLDHSTDVFLNCWTKG